MLTLNLFSRGYLYVLDVSDIYYYSLVIGKLCAEENVNGGFLALNRKRAERNRNAIYTLDVIFCNIKLCVVYHVNVIGLELIGKICAVATDHPGLAAINGIHIVGNAAVGCKPALKNEIVAVSENYISAVLVECLIGTIKSGNFLTVSVRDNI